MPSSPCLSMELWVKMSLSCRLEWSPQQWDILQLTLQPSGPFYFSVVLLVVWGKDNRELASWLFLLFTVCVGTKLPEFENFLLCLSQFNQSGLRLALLLLHVCLTVIYIYTYMTVIYIYIYTHICIYFLSLKTFLKQSYAKLRAFFFFYRFNQKSFINIISLHS